ncbi:MAG: PCMD domain-containing protein [Bacteroidaceae bacterium]|nr:PCMD domain-containing protein [Bacteroidaceae bacterium]
MKFKFTRLLSLMMVMFTMFSVSAFASNKDYYSKITAKAVGEGKVYVSYKNQADAPNYAAESSAESGADNQGSAPTHTYYLYAQASGEAEFLGWFDNENCTGNALSTNTTYPVTIKATESTPASKVYYAKFSGRVFMCATDHVYMNIDDDPAANDGMSVEGVTPTYASSNEAVATVDAEGKLTPVGAGSARITASAQDFEDISFVVTVIDNTTAGITQIGNGDFEDWRGVTSSNHAPDNWNSFETAEGSLASLSSAQQVQMVEDNRPGSNGLYCADIWSRSVLGVVAQGNLTTGCINAGATSASAKNNYNYSKTSDPKKSETLSKVPSAMKIWVKFVPAAVNTQHPNAHVQAIVHGNGNYITYSSDSYDSDNNRNLVIAKAEYDFPSTNGEWKELTIPFVATGNNPDGQIYILVNISTNADPGQGQTGDHMYIDDIELIYPDEPVVYDKYVSVAHDAPVAAPIEVTFNNDNTIDFSLKNFSLDLGGALANVGNVTVPDLQINNQGNFSYDGNIQITAGDKEGVDMWLGPTLGDIPVELNGTIKGEYFYVHLDINIPGAPVEVEVGDKAETTFKVGDALIGTFCAPFTVAIPAEYQSFVTVSTVTGVGEKAVLTLEPITDGIVPAHTPVIVEIPQAFEMPASGIYVKGTPTAGLLTGVYEDTPAPLGSYVLQNIDDKIGFYYVAQEQPTVGANRCYLTVPDSNVKAFFFNEDDATSINEELRMKNEESEGGIYNLAGQRIQKMQKGINIVNGKKILK